MLLAGIYALQLSSFAMGSDLLEVIFVAFLAALLLGRAGDFIWFVVGMALFGLAANGIVNSRLAPQFAGDSIVVVVRIADFPATNGSSATFVAEPLDDARVPPRIRLSWFEPPVTLRLGDVWQLELRLRRPRGSSNPGVFDYEAWLFRERIGAVGYVVGGHRNHLRHSGNLGIIDRVRQRFVDRIVVLSPDSAGVLAAISVGARHLITAEQWDRYARTGTSHLMAISGLHIGLAAGGGYVLASLIGGLLIRGGSHHNRATLFALLVAVSYALVSGLAIPARRASLMIAFVALSVLRHRQVNPLTVVVAACIVVSISAPIASMAPGFKLSFAAVLVLIWLAQRLGGGSDRKLTMRLIIAVRQLSIVQGLLLLGLLPLTVLIFDRVAFVAPVVNLIAVPFIGDPALRVAAFSLEHLEKLIAVAAEVPAAGHTVAAVTGSAWLLLFLVGVAVVVSTSLMGHFADRLAWPRSRIDWRYCTCAASAAAPGAWLRGGRRTRYRAGTGRSAANENTHDRFRYGPGVQRWQQYGRYGNSAVSREQGDQSCRQAHHLAFGSGSRWRRRDTKSRAWRCRIAGWRIAGWARAGAGVLQCGGEMDL